MPDLFWLKAVVKGLVLPPTGPLLVAFVGLGLIARHPRTGRALAAAGVSSLLLLSLPAIAAMLVGWLNAYPPLDPEEAKTAQAIVVLGGGTRRDAREYGGDTLAALTLERVRYGARVARVTGLPVLVSGGVVHGGRSEAALMRESLEQEFGVPVRWAESLSRNTHENAVRSAEILRAAGIARVVLVAHGFDMQRARAEFSAAGIATVAAPTGLLSTEPFTWGDFVPSVAGLQLSYYALYEILGNAARAVTADR
jgi:uncharacterized SAM-binding protein YcdF (DUF218 family)